MYLAFVDDSQQGNPTREGISSVVASGGFFIDADEARRAEKELEQLCHDTGFPADAEFKWSPEKNTWMHSELIADSRLEFQLGVIEILRQHKSRAVFVAEDSARKRAVSTELSAQADVVAMFLERLESRLAEAGGYALLVADRPGGDTTDENKFLTECLDQLRNGTDFVKHDRICFVVATQSRFVRLLQAADLIASCMTAYFAGESTYSPPVANSMLDLFPESMGRRGGCSVKFHPDFVYLNLYHWLLGDTHTGPQLGGTPLPTDKRSYSGSPDAK